MPSSSILDPPAVYCDVSSNQTDNGARDCGKTANKLENIRNAINEGDSSTIICHETDNDVIIINDDASTRLINGDHFDKTKDVDTNNKTVIVDESDACQKLNVSSKVRKNPITEIANVTTTKIDGSHAGMVLSINNSSNKDPFEDITNSFATKVKMTPDITSLSNKNSNHRIVEFTGDKCVDLHAPSSSNTKKELSPPRIVGTTMKLVVDCSPGRAREAVDKPVSSPTMESTAFINLHPPTLSKPPVAQSPTTVSITKVNPKPTELDDVDPNIAFDIEKSLQSTAERVKREEETLNSPVMYYKATASVNSTSSSASIINIHSSKHDTSLDSSLCSQSYISLSSDNNSESQVANEVVSPQHRSVSDLETPPSSLSPNRGISPSNSSPSSSSFITKNLAGPSSISESFSRCSSVSSPRTSPTSSPQSSPTCSPRRSPTPSTITCNVHYLNDIDPFEFASTFLQPPVPMQFTFATDRPVSDHLHALHRALDAPQNVRYSGMT